MSVILHICISYSQFEGMRGGGGGLLTLLIFPCLGLSIYVSIYLSLSPRVCLSVCLSVVQGQIQGSIHSYLSIYHYFQLSIHLSSITVIQQTLRHS